MTIHRSTISLALAVSLLVADPAAAGVLAGRVTSAGAPVAGAMVTATHLGARRGTTVYTDDDGRYRLPPLADGRYEVRARRVGQRETARTLDVAGAETTGDLATEPERDPHELAWQLSANRWLPLLLAQLSSDERREEFVRQCTYCHQQGSWATRVPRDTAEWDKIFTLMARMGGVISSDLRAELPAAFNAAYADEAYLEALTEPAFAAPPPPTAPAVVTEWDLGVPGSMQHDVVVHPDGTVYSVDTNQDRLYRLDPRTDERRSWPIPSGDLPLGGVFGNVGTLVAPNSNSHVGPHSIQVAPDGSLWVTLCLGNQVGRFDPETEEWTIVAQDEGLYPHTLRFDAAGRIWYTLAVSNHVAMIDPATGEQHAIRLPARTWTQALAVRLLPAMLWVGSLIPLELDPPSEGAELPIPYGIDIAPDGGVWFSQLNERRIGRIDPETFDIELIDTPFPGPRRLRFDSQGDLWIPGFSSKLVARYRPSTGEFRTWELPIEGVETPYALNVDRRTDTVWICGTNSDTLIRFEPDRERFTVYPLPTRVTYTREIDFDEDGAVWTSNSNFPSWQIEGSGPKVIRLEPGAEPL